MANYRALHRGVTSLILGALFVASVSSGGQAQADGTCHDFSATGYTVCGLFLQYWNEHGGLAQQGYPISNEFQETSTLDNKVYTVQYFERAKFEHHPENVGTPYEVLLTLLGTYRYEARYGDAGAPGQVPNKTSGDSHFFAETGHWVGGKFWDYWQTHGGLAQQGYPLSDEYSETSDLDPGTSYTVQYFQRAVFEYHPEHAGTPAEVLLAQLGKYCLQGPDCRRPTPTPVPPPALPTSTPVPIFRVTDVTASVSPDSSATCPADFTFAAMISANGAGTVSYKWERSDGAQASVESINFAGSGSQTVTDQWTLSGSYSGWERVRILTPNTLVSNQASFSLTCPMVANFAGSWYHNFGTMDLQQEGDSVTGTYENDFENFKNTVEGKVEGDTFYGTFGKDPSTSVTWKLGADGETFDGSWQNGREPVQWCGARPGAAFPAGCSFAGSWINSVAGTAQCPMELNRTDMHVEGTYCNGSVSGDIDFEGGTAVLRGKWNAGTGNFVFYLDGYKSQQFSGSWDGNAWCGWRPGGTEPSPCLQQ